MAQVDWMVDALEIGNCNCNWGCPCQFNSLPTHGFCCAVGGFHIDKGHYGDIRLDGLKWLMLVHWPGPIHEGNGKWQIVIDEAADADQRRALDAIAHGRDTDEGATFLAVFASTMSETLPTLYKPIHFECDVAARTGSMQVPGMVETRIEPIRNPITGDEHRARIVLPNGMEFTEAEMASGTSKTQGAIELDFDQTYTHLCRVHMNQHGVIR